MKLFQTSGDLLADRRYEIARELAGRGDLEAAADLLAQTVERAPGFASAWFALGDLRTSLAQREDAVAAFERVLALDPPDRHGARLRLAQLGAADPETAMGAGYLRALFDQYAPGFDTALQALAYRGPQLLRDAIARALAAQGRPFRFAQVIDLGCGTGLMAEALVGSYHCLIGVDLSSRMLETSTRKHLYSQLICADMLVFLEAAEEPADLIVAADALVYIADLSPLCRAAAAALSPQGLFAFSVETHAGEGVILGARLRYAHGEAHVREALAAAGLDAIEITLASTRTEAGAPVPGLIAVAGKAAM